MSAENKDKYRDTVFLPKTEFPMRGELPKNEPEIVKKWQEMDLYEKMRKQSRRASRNGFCMTARPTRTATSISATR
jgi:isoleucyl-tRNA synthetase